MKLSKKVWIFLAIGILVILVASLSTVYSQQGLAQSQLNQELSSAGLRLKKYLSEPPSSQKEELESQLAQAQSQLEATKTSLSQSIESIENTDTLFDIAEDCDVEIIGISSSFMDSESLENIGYSVLPLDVNIRGDMPNLIDFIHKWTEQYPTGVVTSVEITVPGMTAEEEEPGEEEPGEEEPEEEEAEEGEPGRSSADLLLHIYTYEGD